MALFLNKARNPGENHTHRAVLEGIYRCYNNHPDIVKNENGSKECLIIRKKMDMYICIYDELKRSEGNNPMIGIVFFDK